MELKQVGAGFGVCYLAKDEWRVTKTGDTISRTYRTRYSTWRVGCPAIGSAHPLAPLCKLVAATSRQIEGGPLCDVLLNYVQDEPQPDQPVPPDDVSENGAVIEVDIRQHPDFESDFAPYWDDEKQAFRSDAPEYLRGTIKWVVGSSTVTVTKYSKEGPENVQPDLGTIKNPGHGYGDEGQWLVITGYKVKRGAFWARTLIYQYSSRPVPTQIYNPAP